MAPLPEGITLTADGSMAVTVTNLDIAGVTVPKGFRFTCSIPDLFVPLVGDPLAPEFLIAACYHDWRYDQQTGIRAEADTRFFRLLLEAGVPEWKAELMFCAVRTYGVRSWEDVADQAAREAQDAAALELDQGLSV